MRPIIRKALLGLTGMLLLCCLTACALDSLIHPPSEQGQQGLDAFVRALRLGEFSAAAAHLIPENRKAFIETFDLLDRDLTITDVRIEQITLTEEGRRADVSLGMEYFLLPSAVLKTFRFDQTWVYFDQSNDEPVYLVETPFPPFP